MKGGNFSLYLSLFVLLYETNLDSNNFILKTKIDFIAYSNFLQFTKSPHFPLRGNVCQLSKREESALLVYLYYIL